MNLFAFIEKLTSQLQLLTHSKEAALQEAWWIVMHVSGKKKHIVLLEGIAGLSHEQQTTIQTLVTQRTQEKKPLQYILQSVPFCNLTLTTKPPVLIPRPETEELCMWLITQLKRHAKHPHRLQILDLCTGSGCIAISLAAAFPQADVIAVDISEKALTLAKENAAQNNVSNITFIQSDLFNNLPPQRFDLIVSNPPYLSEAEWTALSPEILLWEDKNALVAPYDGLFFYIMISKQASNWLKPLPQLPFSIVFECGHTQAKKIAALLTQASYTNITTHTDMQNIARWLSASR